MQPHIDSKLKVALWASETPEQFVLNVRSLIHKFKQMEHDVKFYKHKYAVATVMLKLEIAKDKYAQVCNSEKNDKREQWRKHTHCLLFP